MPKGVYKRTKPIWNKGMVGVFKQSKESRLKIKETMIRKGLRPKPLFEEANPNWTGDNVTYHGLHLWVSNKLGTPQFCEHCKRTKPPKRIKSKHSYFQWANVSRKYVRDLNDWKRLCCKCHAEFDKEKYKRKSKSLEEAKKALE